ncbi:hypothetical protein ABKW28_02300 [Nocardioides sp. 31GB23]|uniref:hypothetical protein n=1 Tax=Nocardioides sp. 31GB23 TaxID=3156065 RepID=UPI0032AF2CEF
MIEPREPTDRAESVDTDVFQAMRHYDRLAPDGATLAEQVLAQVQSGQTGTARRVPAGLAAGLAAASVVAILATSYAVTSGVNDNRVPDRSPANSLATRPSAPASTEPTNTSPSDAALLDPLAYRLVLAEPQSDGTVASTITVANRSGEPVTDPSCLHNANYNFGLVPLDQPESTLDGLVETKCAGAQELAPGFNTTFEGPTFSIRGLRAGDYLATIDFGDARSERLVAPVTVP